MFPQPRRGDVAPPMMRGVTASTTGINRLANAFAGLSRLPKSPMPPLPRLKESEQATGPYAGFTAYTPGVQLKIWEMLRPRGKGRLIAREAESPGPLPQGGEGHCGRLCGRGN